MKSSLFNKYAELVSKQFDIYPTELLSKKNKSRKFVEARYMLYYLCHKRNMKIVSIREYMANHDFEVGSSPMLYGIRQMQKKVDSDPDYKSVIDSISNSVGTI